MMSDPAPMDTPETGHGDAGSPRRKLSCFDSTCIIVGIIIGAGIYETAPMIAGALPRTGMLLLVWLAGGVLALCGALCYAELATAYPRAGGDYVYLTRAYGRPAGFLFGWMQLWIVRPGDIAMMAFIFGRYAQALYPIESDWAVALWAGGAVVVMTLINIAGVSPGKWTQNVLTVAKVIGLLVVIVAGLAAPGAETTQPVSHAVLTAGGLRLAMILVLFTYGGWNEMAYVAAEVRNPNRNILRALVAGTVAVTVLYVLANAAFVKALGYEGAAASEAVAVDTLATWFPGGAAKMIAVLICLSTLGAINGLTLTGARICYALGAEHRLFRLLGRWDENRQAPVPALVAQGTLSMAIIVLAGRFVDAIIYTAPVVWLFFLLTGAGLFRLRYREADVPRPYRVVFYPVTPIIFCTMCAGMLYASVTYAHANMPAALWVAAGVFAAGVVAITIERNK